MIDHLPRRLIFGIGFIAACGGTAGSGVDASGDDVDASQLDASPLDASPLDASTDAPRDMATDDFERATLGPDWTVIFPPAPNDQVRIIGGSDLGMGPGPQGFFLVNYTARAFTADQFGEATIPLDVNPQWIHQVYVRSRASDRARYGFGYNGDPGQPTFGDWYFKYDGVPSAQTRVFATAPAPMAPRPGDRIRVEIVGYTLRGYWNGTLVLEATDTDASKIAGGVPGLAARWATGNTATTVDVKVWESWSGGSL